MKTKPIPATGGSIAKSHFDYRAAYRRNLPHIQPADATLFVTFRLAGSLPRVLVDHWRNEQEKLLNMKATNPQQFALLKPQFERKWFAKFESILDGGSCGPLWLKDERLADLVADSLHYRDGKVYRLDAFSIMPNHTHVVFKPLPLQSETVPANESYHSLASIMQSLKGFTAYECNRLLGREGEFWVHESYDHYVRDHDEWMSIIGYVMNNPVKAGFVNRWEDWKWNYCRLQIAQV